MAGSPFFNSFPKINYNITGAFRGNLTTVTNIFHRLGYLKEILNNISSYYLYDIRDGDTPEILAEKVYGDVGAGWMIVYANNIVDPQWDWPLDDETLKKYIIDKYGSLSAATTLIHHYEKVTETTVDGITTTRIQQIDGSRLIENSLDVPYEYFTRYRSVVGFTVDSTLLTADSVDETADGDCFAIDDSSLTRFGSYETFNVNGKTVDVRTYSRAVTSYDYEIQRNEDNRSIKIVKAIYYEQIQSEFRDLTESFPRYVRTFV